MAKLVLPCLLVVFLMMGVFLTAPITCDVLVTSYHSSIGECRSYNPNRFFSDTNYARNLIYRQVANCTGLASNCTSSTTVPKLFEANTCIASISVVSDYSHTVWKEFSELTCGTVKSLYFFLNGDCMLIPGKGYYAVDTECRSLKKYSGNDCSVSLDELTLSSVGSMCNNGSTYACQKSNSNKAFISILLVFTITLINILLY